MYIHQTIFFFFSFEIIMLLFNRMMQCETHRHSFSSAYTHWPAEKGESIHEAGIPTEGYNSASDCRPAKATHML